MMENRSLKYLFLLLLSSVITGPIRAESIYFKSALNQKELVLSWKESFDRPRIRIQKGDLRGHALLGQGEAVQATLPGDHWVRVHRYLNNDQIHLVLFELRKGEFGFHAWSLDQRKKGKIFAHDLKSLKKLKVEKSLMSSAGSTFDFKEVMRVERTDKFFNFTHKNEDYLQCHYLGRLQGFSAEDEACSLYQRLMNLSRYSSFQEQESSCLKGLLGKEFYNTSQELRAKEFAQCFSMVPSEQGCFENYLKGKTALSRCGSEQREEEDYALELKGAKLGTSLSLASTSARDQFFEVEGSRYQAQLNFDLADELVTLHCASQFLAATGSVADEGLIREAKGSCVAAYFEGRAQSARWFSYLTKWFVEKKLHHQLIPILPAPDADIKLGLAHWLGQSMGDQRAAEELVRQGIFNLPPAQREAWRGPASVSP